MIPILNELSRSFTIDSPDSLRDLSSSFTIDNPSVTSHVKMKLNLPRLKPVCCICIAMVLFK